MRRRHVPLESIVNMYYGESEKRLSAILKLCEQIDDCIIFIDEVRVASMFHRRSTVWSLVVITDN